MKLPLQDGACKAEKVEGSLHKTERTQSVLADKLALEVWCHLRDKTWREHKNGVRNRWSQEPREALSSRLERESWTLWLAVSTGD